MRRRTFWLVTGAIVAIAFVGKPTARAASPAAANSQRIASLIRDLDSNQFAAREAASAGLLEIGEPAVPAVKAVLENPPSVEARTRAERLVREIIVWGDMPHELSLPALMKVMKDTTKSKDPGKACQDGRLERLLDCWVRVLAQTGGQEGSRLPVAFGAVKLAPFEQRGDEGGTWTNSLLIVKRGRIKAATGCIILADKPVEIETAEKCIVLSRSIVSFKACRDSLVVAGQFVESMRSEGNIVVAGSQVTFESACDCVVAAESGITTRFNVNVALVNSRLDDDSVSEGVRGVRLAELHLADPAAKNPIAERVRLMETLWQGDPVARVRVGDGKDQIVRCGESVNGVNGKPPAGLGGWTLCFAKRGLALFTNGDDFAMLRVRP